MYFLLTTKWGHTAFLELKAGPHTCAGPKVKVHISAYSCSEMYV